MYLSTSRRDLLFLCTYRRAAVISVVRETSEWPQSPYTYRKSGSSLCVGGMAHMAHRVSSPRAGSKVPPTGPVYIHTCIHPYIHTCLHTCLHTYCAVISNTILQSNLEPHQPSHTGIPHRQNKSPSDSLYPIHYPCLHNTIPPSHVRPKQDRHASICTVTVAETETQTQTQTLSLWKRHKPQQAATIRRPPPTVCSAPPSRRLCPSSARARFPFPQLKSISISRLRFRFRSAS